MLKLKISITLILLAVISTFSQENLNDYKYIIIPSQYDFQKSEDSFQINSLMKFLFEKADFEVYMDTDEFPEELAKNRCLGLTASLNDNSKMLVTKMNIDLIDCQNKVVYSTVEGKSKIKEYKKAYHECIRKTFTELEKLEYAYNGAVEGAAVSEVLVVEKAEENAVVNESTGIDAQPIANASVIGVTAVGVSSKTEPSKENSVAEITVGSTVLYAQPTVNGFQLVDGTPKVIYVLVKMNVPDVYSIKGSDGIVYKKDGVWKVDTYIDGKLVTKELNIKFF